VVWIFPPSCTSWISRLTVQNQDLVTTLRQYLDRGEAESIALGLELDADFILLDEKEGRRMAKRLGLKRVGVAGIL
jgi:predicted nucleic acid-binding protein